MVNGARQARWVLAAMLFIVGGWFAAARPVLGQVYNPLRSELDRPFFQPPTAAVRLPGDTRRTAAEDWSRNQDLPRMSPMIRRTAADDPELELAPALPAGPLLETPSLTPNVEDESLTWPGDDPDYDPRQIGPLRQRIAKLRRGFQLWTGWGADHSERYIGMGDPLTNTSWLNRPWSFGAFIGSQTHEQLVDGRLAQTNSALGGARLGLDFDYYWGLEVRYGYSNPNVYVPGTTTYTGSARDYYVDLAYMYYPWGDSRWRPYFSAGLGSATYRVSNGAIKISDSAVHVPLGIGLKYFYSPWLTFRFDAEYAMSLGTGSIDFQNEFMVGLGAEVRFGGRRTSYYPWVGNAAYW